MNSSLVVKIAIVLVALSDADINIIKDIQTGGNARDKAIELFLANQQAMQDAMRYLTQQQVPAHEIEDIIQEAAISFDRNIRNHSFREESSLKTYFLSIVRFQLKNFVRKNNRNKTDSLDTIDVPQSSILEKMDMHEKQKILYKLVEGLGARCKELLTLFQFNFSMREIAEKMSFSSDQVASNEVGKCKSKLKDIILANSELIELFKFTH